MSFVSGEEMRALEEAAFARGIPAERLMDLAGAGIARRLMAAFPQPGRAVAYVGKGNNGGDALVVLRHLREAGWQTGLRSAIPQQEWTDLARRKLDELGPLVDKERPLPPLTGPLVLLDGLLGIGAKGAPRGPLKELADEMQTLRRGWGAVVAAIDLPSGLDADSGEGDSVTADLTVTIGAPKKGLADEKAIDRVGSLWLVPLDDLPPPDSGDLRLFCPDLFHGLLTPRTANFHKGDAGRLGIVAGSPGFAGAAAMCATAALAMGAGLIVLHADPATAEALRSLLPPEIMLKISDDPARTALEARHDALVAGPGWGEDPARVTAILDLLESSSLPAVVDADALNGIAKLNRFNVLKDHHLITPHPGEFKRLAPDLAKLPRTVAAQAFVKRWPCTLLLKGARTLVASPDQPLRFNPTGHPGMASGGQGDTLSGVAGALLASGLSGPDTGSLAAWLCGRVAERAAAEGGPFTSASQTILHLGDAVRDWQRRLR